MGKTPRRAATARILQAIRRGLPQSAMGGIAAYSSSKATIDSLEKRVLFSSTPAVAARASSKLDSSLTAVYQEYLQSGTPANSFTSTDSLLQIDDGDIQLQLFAKLDNISALKQAAKRLQGQDIQAHGREVDAILPIDQLGKLATVPSLRFAEPVAYVTHVGAVTSQGDIADAATAARNDYGLTGAGVKVGIVSDSFNHSSTALTNYTTDINTGDLPANVQIIAEDPSAATDEGRAMAQLIYDSAPGATLAFATGAGGASTMAADIKSLATDGAKIIVDDFSYLTEPMFEDGPIAQAVQSVVAGGVTYFSAAGNYGQQSYANTWSAGITRAAGAIPSAAGAPYFYGGTSFNFGTPTAVNDMQTFTLGLNQSIKLSLQWDSPYFSVSGGSGAQNQVDAYVLNSAGTIVGGSASQTTGADPIQFFQYTNNTGSTGPFSLMIVNENVGPTPGYIKYVEFTGNATNWAFTSANTSTIFGHANAVAGEAVGAVNYANTPAYGVAPPVLESNSSSGSTPIFFNTSGVRLNTPIIRQEPGVVGPDGVYTTFFGTKVGSNPYPSFFGTSAAAASVAGVAALVLQQIPTLTPAQVVTALENSATNIGSAPNNLAGYGLVRADAAIATLLGTVTGTVYSDNNGNGAINGGEGGVAGATVYIDANGNGRLDAGEITTTTNANGVFVFNQPGGSATIGVVVPVGFAATTNTSTSTLFTAATTTSNINFGLFPTVYNSSTTDNYLVQIDPTNTANVDVYVGANLTYTAPFARILSTLTFNLSGGSRTLTVNLQNGSPFPPGGIYYTATGTGNSLVVNGAATTDTVSITGETFTINGANVFASGVQSETFNGDGGNDTATIVTAQPTGNFFTYNGSTGNDTLIVNSALPANGATTIFNAGTSSTEQNVLTINAGTYAFTGDPGTIASNLTVNDNSIVTFAAGVLNSGINPRHLAALNIGSGDTATVSAPPSHADRAVLLVNTLSISGTGKLNLDANDMVITSGSYSTISPLLTSGFATGHWNGSGIQSTAAMNNTAHLTALGMVSNNVSNAALYGSGTTLGLFDGQSPALNAILIKYTFYGDANLDGKVDGTDYSRVDASYLAEQTGGSMSGWGNGDFNYDGVVNGTDYTLIDNAFNTQGSPLS